MFQGDIHMKWKELTAAVTSAAIAVSAAAALPQTAFAAYSRVAVHDPSIVKLDDGSYFIIGSHLGAARSTDLMNWTSAANSAAGSTKTTFFNNIYTDLSVPNSWSNTSSGYDLSGNLWAPDIIWNDTMNKYCMYLSVNGVDWHSSIVLCTADNVEGPYSYQGTVVWSGFETNPADSANSYKNTDVEKVLGSNPDLSRYLNSSGRWNAEYGTNAIDPCTFYDEGGNLWMVYGSWFGGIYMLELDETTGLRDYSVTYPTTSVSGAVQSDAYLGTHVAGGYWASGEGPYIEYMCPPGSSQGYYYLFLSYGYFNNKGGYNMRIFRSTSPSGPYYDQNSNSPIFSKGTDNIAGNIGERLMSNYQWSCNDRPNTAQGHNSALMDDDGKLFVIYHNKFDDNYGFHEVRVHQMILNEDGWPTATSYEYSGETLSANGHTTEAIVGDYELIWHNPNQAFVNEVSADVEKPINITLNANGTVTGDISATWQITKAGTPYMSFTWGGVTYKGAFIVQADEADTPVTRMTFTATGINICIWGSKKTAYDITEDLVDRTSDSSLLVYQAADSAYSTASATAGGTALLSGVSYFITSRHSGLALDLAGGGTADGTNIQQWNLTGGKHQEWRLHDAGNGDVCIVSMADENIAITVNDGNAEIAQYTGADNQLFRLIEKRGSYGIVSKASGYASGLDVFGWSTESGGNIAEYEYWGGDCQLWNFTAVCPTVNDGKYTIRNVNSNLFLSAAGSGSIVQAAEAQVWTLTSLGDEIYSICDASGAAMTVADGSSADGQDIALAANTGGSQAQTFRLYPNEDGSYTLLTAASLGKSCADVYGISLDAGANICQWSFWGGSGQKFIIEPVAAETVPDDSTGVIGDVDCNGLVELADAVLFARALAGVDGAQLSAQGVLNSDCDRSGVGAEQNDFVLLLQYLGGKIHSFV